MSKLHKYAFSDLYDISSGISSTKEQAGHGAPFVSFSTVFNNYFLPDELLDLMDTTAVDQDRCSVKKGDILITRTSETVNELAMSCVVLKDYPKATFSGFVKRLRPKTTGIAYDKYMAFFLRSDYFRKVINAKTIMTLRASFNEDIFSFLDLYLPDYEEQIKIGDFLYNIEKKIQCNKKINDNLQCQIKLMYDYWFTQFDFPDENGKPYRSSGGAMVWNEQLKRKIPADWQVKQLKECVSSEKNAIVDGPFGTQMKISEYVSEGVPVYEMNQLNGAFIVDKPKHFLTEQKYEEVKRSTAKNGDIIISKTGTLGLLGIVKSEYEKGIIVSRLVKITPNPNIIGKYSLLIFLHQLADNGYWLKVCGGSTMPILNNGIIEEVKIAIPNNDLYQIYEKWATPLFEKIYEVQRENLKLTSLRDWLLPMLMNGQATISD